MTKMELVWLAGLLEGEGSFLKGPPSAPNRPRVAVEMTDYDIIWQVKRLFGVKYMQKNDRNPRWKRSYTVSLKGRAAIELMQKLRPFMGSRRKKQIDVAIKSFTDLKPGDNSRKLTEKQVRQIRASKEPSEKVSKFFGVSGKTVRKIRRSESWASKHAQLPRNTNTKLGLLV